MDETVFQIDSVAAILLHRLLGPTQYEYCPVQCSRFNVRCANACCQHIEDLARHSCLFVGKLMIFVTVHAQIGKTYISANNQGVLLASPSLLGCFDQYLILGVLVELFVIILKILSHLSVFEILYVLSFKVML